MPRDGAITFGDLVGKLDVLAVECPKCERRGRYAVRRLIEAHGQAGGISDRCAARCPDLPKVL
jgi:hypothetical protein